MENMVVLSSILSKVEENTRVSTLDYTSHYLLSIQTSNVLSMQIPDVDQALSWAETASRIGAGIVTFFALVGLILFLRTQLQKYNEHQQSMDESKQQMRHKEFEWIKSLWKTKE